MYNIYLLEKFNNYYNRRIIRYDTLTEYLEHQTNNDTGYVSFQANFIPNDGVSTEHIVNAQQLNFTWNPDYVLIVDSENNIFQRWFVIDSVRTTMGQYRLSLKRDSVSDFFSETVNAPCFIEKATLPDTSPFIYNSENFSVNQIKTSETPLMDETGCPWIVGYISGGEEITDITDPPDNLEIKTDTIDITVPIENNLTEYTSLSQHPMNEYIRDTASSTKSIKVINQSTPKLGLQIYTNMISYGINSGYVQTSMKFDVNKIEPSFLQTPNGYPKTVESDINGLSASFKRFGIEVEGSEGYDSSKNFGWAIPLLKGFDTISTDFANMVAYMNENGFQEYLWNAMKDAKNFTEEVDTFNALKGYDGNTFILTENNKSYKCTLKYVEKVESFTYKPAVVSTSDTVSMYGQLRDLATRYLGFGNYKDPSTGNLNPFVITGKTAQAYLVLTKVEIGNYLLSLPKVPPSLSDAPYRMFCIPYGDIKVRVEKDNAKYTFTTSKEMAFTFANKISALLSGSGWLLDLQILPYCPVRNYIGNPVYGYDQKKYIELPESNLDVYSLINVSGSTSIIEAKSVLIWCDSSSFTFNVDYNIKIKDVKLENQCDVYRLCSPNYAGVFEFNAAKNGGVNFINVDCTYKPYNPWIHLNPDFGQLYGSDFNDSRGLVCGGDFSLAQSSDKFAAYEMQNKNYQAIFDRQIQNMEVQHKYDMISGIAGAGAGIASGAASGAAAGPWGAVAGAAIGLVGGIADVALAQGRFNETLDYTKDLFGYQLDNIKALPNSLVRTTSYNINSKYFPFIEYYTCTEEEKQAFKNKIQYNGMTVGIISSIAGFIRDTESYIKGKLIIQNINDDFHITNDIASEINKGVRIKR